MPIGYLVPADVSCPGPLPSFDLLNHVCDLSFFSYPDVLSRYVMFNILLSICVCAAASSLFAWVVSAHVYAQYVIAESTHESKT